HAVSLARFASASLHVEAESSGLVASRARFGNRGEYLADGREQARVRRGVRARGAPDWALIDVDHPIDLLQPFDGIAGRRIRRCVVQSTCDMTVEGVV